MGQRWNWELKGWPNFVYEKFDQNKEARFLKNSGFILGILNTVNNKDMDAIRIEIISNESLKTSQIEGEILDRESLQMSIKRHFGIKHSNIKMMPKESGIADMMMLTYETFSDKLTHSFLYKIHKALFQGNISVSAGKYRTHSEPMQIVSGNLSRPKIHFEAPPSQLVKPEMIQFIKWFNESHPDKPGGVSCLERAAIAHLHFESIHPFEDGNGRIGRALVKKIISQHIGSPTLISLSSALLRKQKSYYVNLEKYSQTLDISGWINFFSDIILEAQQETIELIQFILFKSAVLANKNLNTRQTKVLKRIFKEGLCGFKGGLSAENYIAITKTSRATATRDLAKLVQLEILCKTGNLKNTRYFLQKNKPNHFSLNP